MLSAPDRFAGRLVPARPDLAAARLRGRVEAARFVEGEARGVACLADLTLEPDPAAERATQLLPGERFTVYETASGLAWGQAEDGYVGWVAAEALGPPVSGGRRVAALAAHVYPRPDIKARPTAVLPFLSRVAVEADAAAEAAGFARLAAGGYLCRAHLAPDAGDAVAGDAVAGEAVTGGAVGGDAVAGDAVAVAERFLGAPYLWGGRSAAGLDCSALVQLALMATGTGAPRDTDMQASLLGAPVAEGEERRGDLVFWKGHVAIVAGGGSVVHANAHHMAVAREPLAAAAGRIAAAGGGGVTARRRVAAGAGWRPDRE